MPSPKISTPPRTIVITGVSRGLGYALAHAWQGHLVWGCARRLPSEWPEQAQFTALDVRDAAAVSAWAEQVIAAVGAPDLLINNAAVINQPAPLWQVPAAEFDALIDINIKGVTNVLRAFVPAMVARQSGVIVNLSSGWGRSTSADVAPYCASKWAIEGLTQALAQELPAGMAAIPLSPGVIHTEMLDTCFGEAAAGYETADQWAKRAAPFMLSLAARHTGQALTVP